MGKPYIDFAAVKAAVQMTQVLGRYGLLSEMRSIRNGDGYEGRCPIHKGSSKDQFKVSVSKNCWNCFGSECQCGGNVLDFVAKMEGIDARDAAARLNEWFSLGLEQQAPASGDRDRSKSPAKERNGSKPSAAGQVSSPEELEEEQGSNAPLNFTLQNLQTDHPYIAERGLSPETAEAFGLGYCTKGTMASRLVIPVHNRGGELVGYVGRWPGQEPPDGRPKYKLPAGFKKTTEVFNLHRALQEPADKPLIVVEGFFGVMAVWQHGWKRIGSIIGSHLSVTQESLLIEAARESGIILMLDEDDAGRIGRDKALCRLARHLFVRVVQLPREGAQPEHLSREELIQLLGYQPAA